MLTQAVFIDLVKAAVMAPSCDNMQPWEFRKREDGIDVFMAQSRLVAVDVLDMFSRVSIGAAIQNLVEAAGARGMAAVVDYGESGEAGGLEARVRITPGRQAGDLSESLATRMTDRRSFDPAPLEPQVSARLTEAAGEIDAGIHWLGKKEDRKRLVSMEAAFLSILLEHRPFFDGLFDTVRLTRREIASTRCGMDIGSMGLPLLAALLVRSLRHHDINRAIRFLGIGPRIAGALSARLFQAGAVCLVTARRRDSQGYLEAGRALERVWLAATAEGLAIQPYGLIPQYLTLAELRPEAFGHGQVAMIEAHRETFGSLFPTAKREYPALLLRIGRARKSSSSRSTIRLAPNQVIRECPEAGSAD